MAGPPPGADRLEGELVGFTFQNPEKGFGVARLRGADRREVVAIGPISHVSPGQHVALTGRWEENSRFGRQFKVDSVMVEDPRTTRGLSLYLGSGAVKGLGPEFAQRIVDRFGLDTLRIIEHEPQKLLEVPGIGQKRLAVVIEHWQKDQAHREVYAALRGFDIGAATAQRIVERYGKEAMGVVTREPYRLAAEIPGVGFLSADRIARQCGIGPEDPARARAAAIHVLREAEGEGHCLLPEQRLLEGMERLRVPAERQPPALAELILRGELVRGPAADPAHRPCYRPELDQAEDFAAWRIADLLKLRAPARPPDLAAIEAGLSIRLAEGQRAAVLLALSQGVSVITGGPGTGKTTITRALYRAALARGEAWLLCAPTGRAARRLAESTGAEARTIHRLLSYNPRSRGFDRNATTPLECQGLLVDEASMVDLRLFVALLAALPAGARLVLVGDADQLPSVGAGRVLHDLIASGVVPVATLTEVYRQAQDSGIVRNAWRIHRGEVPLSGQADPQQPAGQAPDFFSIAAADATRAQDQVVEIITRRLPRLGFDPRQDVQVLTPMHNGQLGTEALNARLGAELNPGGAELERGGRRFRVGDRVIQARNNYDLDIFNGDVGRIEELQGSTLTVDFDGRRVELSAEQLDDLDPAWAISIHKSQGSEYPAVLVCLHRSHRIMLRRNLLYTAITRARRFCCLVGDPEAISRALAERGGDERYSRLEERIAAVVQLG